MSQKIIDCALEIIAGEGFDSLTMRRLAGRMGTSAPNIYNYYSSKDELFCAIRIQGFETLINRLQLAFDGHKNAADRTKAMLQTYIDFGINERSFYETIFNRTNPGQTTSQAYADYAEHERGIAAKIPLLASRTLKDLMREAQKPCTDDEIKLSILHIWSLLHGIIGIVNGGNQVYIENTTRDTIIGLVDKLADELTRGTLPVKSI